MITERYVTRGMTYNSTGNRRTEIKCAAQQGDDRLGLAHTITQYLNCTEEKRAFHLKLLALAQMDSLSPTLDHIRR